MELFIAARGWDHPSWSVSYYPEDLPEDWQLSFYSNEFRAAVVPASEWIDIDPVEIERWIDDAHEEFMFFLEVEDPLADWGKIAERTSYMGGQLGGFLFRPEEVDADLAIISTSLTSATKIAPVCLLLPDDVELSQVGRSLLDEHAVECCWNVGQGEPGWTGSQLGSQLAVARVTGNKTFTAREWREIIETCIQYGNIQHTAGTRRVLLMIDSEEPRISDLRTATIIGDMLVMPVA